MAINNSTNKFDSSVDTGLKALQDKIAKVDIKASDELKTMSAKLSTEISTMASRLTNDIEMAVSIIERSTRAEIDLVQQAQKQNMRPKLRERVKAFKKKITAKVLPKV